MAILDLSTGKATDQEAEFSSGPTYEESRRGNVLDLATGKPLPKQEPAATQQEYTPVDPATMRSTPFPADRESTRAVAELPELGQGGLLSGEDQAKVAAITPVLLTATNPQEIGNILSNTFENVGIQYDEGGNIIATNNKSGARVVLNKPGLSQIDVLQGLGIATAFTPAARLASIPAAVTARVAGGATASGLTQAALEGIQSQLGGELDADEIAIASALGGAAEAVVPAIQALRESRRAATQGAERAEMEAARRAIDPAQEARTMLQRETGVDVGLFRAQQTLVPSELLKQRVLPQLDASSRKAAAALERQNKEVFDATSEMISKIGGDRAVETGSARFRTASQLSLDARRQARSAATRQLYREAFEQGGDVDLAPVNEIIDSILSGAPKGSEFESVGLKLRNLVSPLEDGATPTLEQLQKAKITMQDMIDAVGEKAVSGSIKRDIVQVKKALTEKMREASPLYGAADDEFRRLSPAVTELDNSILGSVSRLQDVNIKNIAQKIFDPKAELTDPTAIRNARRVIEAVDPGAWDDILRVELNRRVGALENLGNEATGELVGNLPAQLKSAVFGNPAQRKALYAGMNEDQKRNFRYLEEVLRRASAGRAAGSPTAAFGQAIEKMRGVAGIMLDYIFSPVASAKGLGFDARVGRVAEIMLDPAWQPQMRRLERLNPNSPAAARAMAQLLNIDQEQQ